MDDHGGSRLALAGFPREGHKGTPGVAVHRRDAAGRPSPCDALRLHVLRDRLVRWEAGHFGSDAKVYGVVAQSVDDLVDAADCAEAEHANDGGEVDDGDERSEPGALAAVSNGRAHRGCPDCWVSSGDRDSADPHDVSISE